MSLIPLGILAASGSAKAGSYESIASATGNGTTNTYTFSSIPQTYVALQLRMCVLEDAANSLSIRLNGITSGYAYHSLYGDGATVGASGGPGAGRIYMVGANAGGTVGTYPNVAIVDILNYQSTTQNKTVRSFFGADRNASGGSVELNSGLFIDTTAVSSLTVFSGANFNTGSTFALYGIKGA